MRNQNKASHTRVPPTPMQDIFTTLLLHAHTTPYTSKFCPSTVLPFFHSSKPLTPDTLTLPFDATGTRCPRHHCSNVTPQCCQNSLSTPLSLLAISKFLAFHRLFLKSLSPRLSVNCLVLFSSYCWFGIYGCKAVGFGFGIEFDLILVFWFYIRVLRLLILLGYMVVDFDFGIEKTLIQLNYIKKKK